MRDQPSINFSGGNPNVGAIGSHATGHVHAGSYPSRPELAEIDRRLSDLRALLDRHAAVLADLASARAAIDAAAEELRTQRPEPSRVRLFLNAIAGAAPGVTAISQAVRDLSHTVNTTFSGSGQPAFTPRHWCDRDGGAAWLRSIDGCAAARHRRSDHHGDVNPGRRRWPHWPRRQRPCNGPAGV
jgi:hypothetical protein